MAKKKKKAKVVQFTKALSPKNYIIKIGRKLPIYKVFGMKDFKNMGKGHMFIVREKKNGEKVVGAFFVDTWCLGVKDTFFRILPHYEYLDFEKMLYSQEGVEMIDYDPNYAYNLIYGAIEYAEEIELKAHKDFAILQYLLDDIEDIEYVDIEFGRDGKVFYSAGLDDNISGNIKTLERVLGKGNFGLELADDRVNDIEYVEDFIDNLDGLLPDEKDRLNYMAYSDILNFIEIEFDSINELKDLYLNDQIKLRKIIDEAYLKTDDEFFDKIQPIIENYIVYRDTDFISNDVFIASFNYRDYNILKGILQGVLNETGKDKIKIIFDFVRIAVIDDANAILEMVEYFENDLDGFVEDYDGFMALFIKHFILYQKEFGEFSLKEIETLLNG